MPIYKIASSIETNPKVRLVAATNKAQALAHVAKGTFTVEACSPDDVAQAFIESGVKAVERAGE